MQTASFRIELMMACLFPWTLSITPRAPIRYGGPYATDTLQKFFLVFYVILVFIFVSLLSQ